jgi:transcriptional regulator with XRE-family HTH domain
LAICQRLGLTQAQLADRVRMKAETMRKVVRGYQPASERTMELIRNVERMTDLLRKQAAHEAAPASSPYGLMKLETLQRNFVEVAEQLERAAAPGRRTRLGNLRAMLDELARREPPVSPAPSGPLTEAQNIALQASSNLDRARAPEAGPAPAGGSPAESPAKPAHSGPAAAE